MKRFPVVDEPLSDNIASVDPLASSASFSSPLDATPTPDGTAAFFTALTDEGPAVFRVAPGAGAATRLVAGERGAGVDGARIRAVATRAREPTAELEAVGGRRG